MTTIVLADDHAIVRDGVRALLGERRSFEVVGEAGDGLEALRVVERVRPNVLVTDVVMPGLTGIELTRRVRTSCPETRVVVLSMYAHEAYVGEAFRHGASAYVLKTAAVDDLIHAIDSVRTGRRYVSPPLSEEAIEAYLQRGHSRELDPYDLLTAREREVLKLAAEGHTNAEIGARLFISPRTVETHRANLSRKLRLRNQTELVRYALRRGLLPQE